MRCKKTQKARHYKIVIINKRIKESRFIMERKIFISNPLASMHNAEEQLLMCYYSTPDKISTTRGIAKQLIYKEDYTFFKQARIVIKIDAFSTVKYKKTVQEMADEGIFINYTLSTLDLDYNIISSTVYDWQLYVCYCAKKGLTDSLWNTFIEKNKNVFAPVLNVVHKEMEDVNTCTDAEIQILQAEDLYTYDCCGLHLSVSARIEVPTDVALYFATHGLDVYIERERSTADFVCGCMTGTLKQWEFLLHELKNDTRMVDCYKQVTAVILDIYERQVNKVHNTNTERVLEMPSIGAVGDVEVLLNRQANRQDTKEDEIETLGEFLPDVDGNMGCVTSEDVVLLSNELNGVAAENVYIGA